MTHEVFQRYYAPHGNRICEDIGTPINVAICQYCCLFAVSSAVYLDLRIFLPDPTWSILDNFLLNKSERLLQIMQGNVSRNVGFLWPVLTYAKMCVFSDRINVCHNVGFLWLVLKYGTMCYFFDPHQRMPQFGFSLTRITAFCPNYTTET